MQGVSGPVDAERFSLMFPGERRSAVRAVGRVLKFRGGRAGAVHLVASAYAVLAEPLHG